MPSSPPSEGHQSKKESVPTSSDISSDPNQQPPTQPDGHPPPPDYPSAMWHAPQMGYPAGQYPANYYNQTAYPNAPNQYAYAQPPPAGYYFQQNNERTIQEKTEEGLIACVCLFICVFFFVTIVTGLTSLIVWYILLPQIPCFHVEAMSVTNFNTSTPFTATWDVNVAVESTNTKLKAYFDQIQCMIFYDGTGLGSTRVPSFYMETKTKTGMGVRISTNGSDEAPVPIWVTLAIDKDRTAQGSVTFSLRCFMILTLKNEWWAERELMKVNCGGLKMDIAAGSESGGLAPGKLDYCQAYE